MKVRRGERPLAIKLFAVALLLVALAGAAEGLSDLGGAALRLSLSAPWIAWDRDAVIVAIFSEASIALIPLVWIYVFAARGARWMVLGFGLIKLLLAIRPLIAAVRFDTLDAIAFIEPALICFALVMLFTPGASRWMRRSDKEVGSAVFE